MSNKQFGALIAVLLFIGSPFVAREWVKVVQQIERRERAKHEAGGQVPDDQRRYTDAEIEQMLESKPIRKAWEQFQSDVTDIRTSNTGYYGKGGIFDVDRSTDPDIKIWCDKMLGAIQDRDVALFNYLAHQLVEERFKDRPWLVKELHYLDLNEPGLTPADIEALSKFIKPETEAKSV
jgi:hypothetical protein